MKEEWVEVEIGVPGILWMTRIYESIGWNYGNDAFVTVRLSEPATVEALKLKNFKNQFHFLKSGILLDFGFEHNKNKGYHGEYI